MQTPPPQPFTPPKGFSAPQGGGTPKWFWAIAIIAVLGVFAFVGLFFAGFAGLGKATAELAKNPNEKISHSRMQVAADLPEGWTRASSENVSIGLPPRWVTYDMTNQQFSSSMDKAGERNPEIATMKDQVSQLVANKGFKLFAIRIPEKGSKQYPANLVVIAIDVPGAPSLKRFVDGAEHGIAAAGGQITRGPAQLAGMDAETLRTEITMNTEKGPVTMISKSYYAIKGNTAYSLGVNMGKDEESTLGPDVDKMLETLQIQ